MVTRGTNFFNEIVSIKTTWNYNIDQMCIAQIKYMQLWILVCSSISPKQIRLHSSFIFIYLSQSHLRKDSVQQLPFASVASGSLVVRYFKDKSVKYYLIKPYLKVFWSSALQAALLHMKIAYLSHNLKSKRVQSYTLEGHLVSRKYLDISILPHKT